MRYAIDLHVHESRMRVAVRVLHSCAFIAFCKYSASQINYTHRCDLPECFELFAVPDTFRQSLYTRTNRVS